MSLFDYRVSRQISAADPPFDALLMAALRKADSQNAARLRMAFPHIHAEFTARYDAPGGVLPTDPEAIGGSAGAGGHRST